MKRILFEGTATALATPFLKDGIDEKSLRDLVEFQIAGGVSGMVACGTTGEASTLTEDEWARTVQIVVAQTKGRVPVIAGTGGNNTADVIRRAHKARELGAAAQLCVTPYYNKTTQRGLIAHYTAIAEDGSLPVIIYNVPARTGLSVTAETVAVLSEVDNIVAIKEASANLVLVADILRLCEGRIAVYSGADEVIVPLMSLGGLGVISVISNVAPRQVSDLTDAMLSGDYKEAARLQLRLLPLTHALFSEVSPIPLKAAMALMGLGDNHVRLPLVPLGEENAEKLKQEIKKLGLI
ncbi:MAG: 4-hydroxy-tetrahydrodipicolinate synthase [Eubacteriales bacterium]|jgi:4-hydroxy-tetrahydrodipicolinate synthase|nr:4-hydroxy-tetrahydrodipicolinate synthase [Eubacteriales bacterium]MDD4106047.1 4-hydroxy-tetrahydrodipicolinate synthase [Eubacteriales bacterium]MDD4711366.1 4-hydroxy-tetrahydrodipicolinate synthase [Eubacteriales bacterium]